MAKKFKKYKLHKTFENSLKKIYDIDSVSHMMIKNFFDGHLGKIMLDENIFNHESSID
jgi:hypothetical protein